MLSDAKLVELCKIIQRFFCTLRHGIDIITGDIVFRRKCNSADERVEAALALLAVNGDRNRSNRRARCNVSVKIIVRTKLQNVPVCHHWDFAAFRKSESAVDRSTNGQVEKTGCDPVRRVRFCSRRNSLHKRRIAFAAQKCRAIRRRTPVRESVNGQKRMRSGLGSIFRSVGFSGIGLAISASYQNGQTQNQQA